LLILIIVKKENVKKENVIESKSSYTELFPLKSELDSDCKFLPKNYHYNFSLKEFTSGRVKKFSKLNIDKKEIAYKDGNASYEPIGRFPHVNM